jgi:hypothetical protein
MLFDEDKITEAQQSQRQRGAAFGAFTAERIRAAQKCRFSLLPHEALAHLASSWYDASAQAMLDSNYAPIINWTQVQSQLAAEERFEMEDVLELLRICRKTAIQKERWSEDFFSVVDDAINEGLVSIASEVPWTIPRTLDYVTGLARQPEPAAPSSVPSSVAMPEETQTEPLVWSENWSDDRRDFGRNCLRLPILVRVPDPILSLDEVTHTENVSRSGLYFVTKRSTYAPRMLLKVIYPYWTELGAINREYGAKIVRMDPMEDDCIGIAVEFTESLGPSSRCQETIFKTKVF